ncbi:hypothetical protein [Bremerella volcania]|nr:hypothetical protein [Bremerella volcania]
MANRNHELEESHLHRPAHERSQQPLFDTTQSDWPDVNPCVAT